MRRAAPAGTRRAARGTATTGRRALLAGTHCRARAAAAARLK